MVLFYELGQQTITKCQSIGITEILRATFFGLPNSHIRLLAVSLINLKLEKPPLLHLHSVIVMQYHILQN